MLLALGRIRTRLEAGAAIQQHQSFWSCARQKCGHESNSVIFSHGNQDALTVCPQVLQPHDENESKNTPSKPSHECCLDKPVVRGTIKRYAI